jgi:hypothetical protein
VRGFIVGLLVALAGCGNPTGAPVSVAPGSAAAVVAAVPSPAGPPPVEVACQRDADCAVARIEVTGPHACCPACGTTPGTRRWYAAVERACATTPSAGCGSLACPAGPTRAVCLEGRCAATATDAHGQPTFIAVEQRCLPAMVCDSWVGCAAVHGNTQDGWYVTQADRGAAGELAALGPVCTTRAAGSPGCEAARLYPPGVTCPPWTAPPRIDPAPYACAVVDGICRHR